MRLVRLLLMAALLASAVAVFAPALGASPAPERPSISWFSPTCGPPGTLVAIMGFLPHVKSIKFGGVEAPLTPLAPGKTLVPEKVRPGNVDIEISTSAGVARAAPFQVFSRPTERNDYGWIRPARDFPYQNVPQPFAAVAVFLKARTGVPVILPTTYHLCCGGAPASIEVFELSKHSYHIGLASTMGCNDATVCRIGSISAEGLRPGDPPPGCVPVKLSNGTQAFFTQPQCGASCGDATLAWDVDGYRYSVGEKGGRTDHDLEFTANSMRRY